MSKVVGEDVSVVERGRTHDVGHLIVGVLSKYCFEQRDVILF